MPIKVLDSKTIDHIAAGEVVEKPASVVKELVENAIDAGSKAITVEIKDGGISMIRVTDNGCGIPKEELRTAFLRHATSKISSAEDLNSIYTLGFRGEALSSICAVSQLEIITRCPENLTGCRMQLEGSIEASFSEIGAPAGTTIIVRNLFFNTPARKKFLKSPVTEGSYITDLMEYLAISRPDIAFQYTINGQSRFHTSGSGDLKDVIYRVFGREMASALIPVDVEEAGIHISGFLGKPELVRSNRNFEIYYINNRYVKSGIIAKAIEEGYREYLMLHKFPVCFLRFEINAESVDVNVHPTKMEVRLSGSMVLVQFLSNTIHEALSHREMIPGNVLTTSKELKAEAREVRKEIMEGKNPEPFLQAKVPPIISNPNNRYTGDVRAKEEFCFDDSSQPPVVQERTTYSNSFKPNINPTITPGSPTPSASTTKELPKDLSHEKPSLGEVFLEEPFLENKPKINDSMPDLTGFVQQNLFDDRILTMENRQKFRIVGQVFDTYWIVQYEDKLLMIDQHAAHEKVNYERFMKHFHEKTLETQMLLPAVIVTLSSKEQITLQENMEAFRNMGFEIEEFGGNEYAMRGVPTDLYGASEKDLFLTILDELSEGKTSGSYSSIEERIATMACKASIKGGMHITLSEAEKLIDEMLTLNNPYNCPHGRPTTILMSKYEMERKFKRVVN